MSDFPQRTSERLQKRDQLPAIETPEQKLLRIRAEEEQRRQKTRELNKQKAAAAHKEQ